MPQLAAWLVPCAAAGICACGTAGSPRDAADEDAAAEDAVAADGEADGEAGDGTETDAADAADADADGEAGEVGDGGETCSEPPALFGGGFLNGLRSYPDLPGLVARLHVGATRVSAFDWRRLQPCSLGRRLDETSPSCTGGNPDASCCLDGAAPEPYFLGRSDGASPDDAVAGFLAAGFTLVVPVLRAIGPLDDTGSCAEAYDPTANSTNRSWTPTRPDEWEAFVEVLVERYDGDGMTCPPGRACGPDPDAELQALLREHPLRLWQLEPEWPRVWCARDDAGNTDVTAYLDLLRRTRQAMLRSDPGARLMFAGIADIPGLFFVRACGEGLLGDDATIRFGAVRSEPAETCPCDFPGDEPCTGPRTVRCGDIRPALAACFSGETDPGDPVIPGTREPVCGTLASPDLLPMFASPDYDVADVHAYGDVGLLPGVEPWIRGLMPAGRDPEIWVVEGGGPFASSGELCPDGVHRLTEVEHLRAQTTYLALYYATGLAAGFTRLAWHVPNECRGWGPAWGLLDLLDPLPAPCSAAPRPAFHALGILADRLRGFTGAERVEGAGWVGVRFPICDGRTVAVAWSPTGATTANLASLVGPGTIETASLPTERGVTEPVLESHDAAAVPLDEAPVLLERR